jgi:hypothetical protein
VATVNAMTNIIRNVTLDLLTQKHPRAKSTKSNVDLRALPNFHPDSLIPGPSLPRGKRRNRLKP